MSIIENDDTIIDLNTKVDMFIDWYYEKMVKGKHSEYGEYRLPIEMRNLIEKLAVWYELRYNDYELDRIMNSLDKEGLTLNILLLRLNNFIIAYKLTSSSEPKRSIKYKQIKFIP